MAAEIVEVDSMKQFSASIPEEPVMEIGSLGGGLEIKNRKTIELTHQEAIRVLELPQFAGDRPLGDKHVIFLTRQMESGMFRWEQVQIIICRFDGKEYRMNGQHTCWARLNMPEHNYSAPVSLLKYEAATDHDMRQLYATIDRNKARTSGNVVISYLAGRQEFIHFNKRILKALAESLAFWKWETESQRLLHTPDDRAFLMLTDHYQLSMKVGNFINASKTVDIKHLSRRPVISAMYATFDKAPEIALAFWRGVASGEMLAKDDARMSLRNKLLTSTIAAGGKSVSSDITTTSSEEMFRWCIVAWNHYRQGKPLKAYKVALDGPRQTVR
jgi:hypothetical protein